ncbi:MAG: hypothetical protein AAF709_01740 [Pseudomonadota bacterium]
MVSGEALNLETALAQLYELQSEFDALEAAASNAQEKLSTVVGQLETLSNSQPVIEVIEDELVDIDFSNGAALTFIGNLSPSSDIASKSERDEGTDLPGETEATSIDIVAVEAEAANVSDGEPVLVESGELVKSEAEDAGATDSTGNNMETACCSLDDTEEQQLELAASTDDVVIREDLGCSDATVDEACSNDTASEANVQNDSLVAAADSEHEDTHAIEAEETLEMVSCFSDVLQSDRDKIAHLSTPAGLDEDIPAEEIATEALISEDANRGDMLSDEPELLDEAVSEAVTSEEDEDSIVIAALEINSNGTIDAAALEGDDTDVVKLLDLNSDEDCHGSMHQPIEFDGAAAAAELKQNASSINTIEESVVELSSDLELESKATEKGDTGIATDVPEVAELDVTEADNAPQVTAMEGKTEAKPNASVEAKSEPATDTVVPFPTTQEKTVQAPRKPKKRRMAVAFTGIAASVAACAFALQMPEFQHLRDLPHLQELPHMDQLLQRLSELQRSLV